MNCWSDSCPSNLTTYTGLSSPNCPGNTQEVEPTCMSQAVPAVIGQPAITAQPAIPAVIGQPAIQAQPEVPAVIGQPFIQSQPAIPAVIGQPAIQAQPAVPAVIGQQYIAPTPGVAAVPADPGQPFIQAQPAIAATFSAGSPAVPSVQISPAVPATYNMNCWSQSCPSSLNTYTGQASATCPPSTQLAEACTNNNQQAAFSGFTGNGWY